MTLPPVRRHPTISDVGAAFLLMAAFASSWTGVFVGPLQLSDYLLGLAALLVLLDAATAGRTLHLPSYVWLSIVAVVLIIFAHELIPAHPLYLVNRYGGVGTEAAAAVGLQWLVGLALLPAVVALLPEPAVRVRQVLTAWTLGIAVSAVVAVTDSAGATSISNFFIGANADFFGRQAGLTSQANSLAVACALAAPLALWYWKEERGVIGGLLLAALTGGVFLSGSRGGQVAFVGAVLATGILVASARKLLAMATGVLLTASAVFYRQVGAEIDTYLRFGSGTGVAASDTGRGTRAAQAVADFLHRPIDGIGLQFVLQAHSIYLQVIAAGGAVLALTLIVYFTGTLRAARAVGRSGEPIGYYLAVAVWTWLLVGIVENQLVDRWLYYPVAAAIALASGVVLTDRKPKSPVTRLQKPAMTLAATAVAAPPSGASISAQRRIGPRAGL